MRTIVSRSTTGFFSGLTATSRRSTTNSGQLFMPSSMLSYVSPANGLFQPTTKDQSLLFYRDNISKVSITQNLKKMDVVCRHKDGAHGFMQAISQLPDLCVKHSPSEDTQGYAKITISGLYDVYQAIEELAEEIKAHDPNVSKNPSLLGRRDYYTNTNNYAPELIPLYKKYNTLQSDRAFELGHTTPLCLELFLIKVGVNSKRYVSFISDVADRAVEIRGERDMVGSKLPRRSL